MCLSCGRRLAGITLGFASVAVALHTVGRSNPRGVAIRMKVAQRSGLSLCKRIVKKTTYACSNVHLYHPNDLSFLGKKSRVLMVTIKVLMNLCLSKLRDETLIAGMLVAPTVFPHFCLQTVCILAKKSLRSISGLVIEYIVAIDVTRVRFSADAQL